jgi:hypothetical protein
MIPNELGIKTICHSMEYSLNLRSPTAFIEARNGGHGISLSRDKLSDLAQVAMGRLGTSILMASLPSIAIQRETLGTSDTPSRFPKPQRAGQGRPDLPIMGMVYYR